jgi:hypothetical protein
MATQRNSMARATMLKRRRVEHLERVGTVKIDKHGRRVLRVHRFKSSFISQIRQAYREYVRFLKTAEAA